MAKNKNLGMVSPSPVHINTSYSGNQKSFRNKQGQSPGEKRFFRKQASGGNSLFDFLRSKAKILLPFIIAPVIYFANPGEAKAQDKDNFWNRFSIGASYSYNWCDPLAEQYKQLNEDYRTCATLPVSGTLPNWKDMKSPKDLQTVGAEIKFDIYKNKDLAIPLIVSYEQGTAKADHYNEVYVRGIPVEDPINVVRDEEYTTKIWGLGGGIEKKLGKNFTFGASGKILFNNIDGKNDTLIRVRGPPDTGGTYKQWRDATYSGQGIGSSVEGSFAWQPFDWLSILGSVGYNWGKVEASGEEKRWVSTWGPTPPIGNWQKVGDYNPILDINGYSLKLEAKLLSN